ncbi:hypothetical protein GUJ93_ZPchr0001g29970 [Zizania palustris]|uniref:Uncharacterized protein n=1 Tax=Zizania palustris TaxID=103762 RepID=A0A8J5V8X4_ZIZPA|nr:hypothetical protein GUJ93_ZPchr0001g29970 [Zizania palustris]
MNMSPDRWSMSPASSRRRSRLPRNPFATRCTASRLSRPSHHCFSAHRDTALGHPTMPPPLPKPRHSLCCSTLPR